MSDQIYVDPNVTGAVIQVAGKCYQRVGGVLIPANVPATSVQGSFDDCESCSGSGPTLFCSASGYNITIEGVTVANCTITAGSGYSRTQWGAALQQPLTFNLSASGSGGLGGFGSIGLYGGSYNSNGYYTREYLGADLGGGNIAGVGYSTSFFTMPSLPPPPITGRYANTNVCGINDFYAVGTGGYATIAKGTYGVDFATLPTTLTVNATAPIYGGITGIGDCYPDGECTLLNNPSSNTPVWDGTLSLGGGPTGCPANPNFSWDVRYNSASTTGSWGGFQFNGAAISLIGTNPVQFCLAISCEMPPAPPGSGCSAGGRSFIGFSPTVTGTYIGFLSCMGSILVT